MKKRALLLILVFFTFTCFMMASEVSVMINQGVLNDFFAKATPIKQEVKIPMPFGHTQKSNIILKNLKLNFNNNKILFDGNIKLNTLGTNIDSQITGILTATYKNNNIIFMLTDIKASDSKIMSIIELIENADSGLFTFKYPIKSYMNSFVLNDKTINIKVAFSKITIQNNNLKLTGDADFS